MAGFKGSIDGDSGNNGNMNFVANSRGFTFKSEGKTLLDMTGTGGGSTLDIQSNTTIKDDLLVTGSISIASGSLTGSLVTTASLAHLKTVGDVVFSGSKHEMNGELNLHGGSSNTFVMKALYGDGSLNADYTFRNPLASTNGGSLGVRAYYAGVHGKILSLGDPSNEYWSFTSTALSASDHTIIKAAHISASGDINITGTGSFSGSIVSTGSFGALMLDGGLFSSASLAAGGSGGSGIFADSSSYQGTENDLQITGSVDITGSFSATAKSFVIPHPAKDQGFLQHGSLEGPEHGVYVRGHLNNNNEIILPEYWDPLVDESTISVQLTPIGTWQQLFVKEVSNSKVVVQNRLDGHAINCYYVVQGERKDIPKIELEL